MNHPKVSEYQADPARDYSTLLSMTEGADQSANLPDMYDFVLPKSNNVLKDPANFDEWLRLMTQILRSYRLDKLLDISIPRPERNSIHAAKWQRLSMEVRNWLGHQMAPSIYKMIKDRGYRLELADELILNAHLAFKGPGLDSVARAITPVLLVRRLDFFLVEEYVQAMWDRYDNDPVIQMNIKPCIILSRIFTEVRPEMPQFVEERIRMLDSKGDSWTKLSAQDVNDTCLAILLHVEEMNAARLAQNKQNTDLSNFDSKRCKRRALTETSDKESGASGSTKPKSGEKPAPIDWEAKFGSLLGNARRSG